MRCDSSSKDLAFAVIRLPRAAALTDYKQLSDVQEGGESKSVDMEEAQRVAALLDTRDRCLFSPMLLGGQVNPRKQMSLF